MAAGRLLHARAPQGQGRAGDASIAPGIGGSAVLAPTAAVADGLSLDGGINPTPFAFPSSQDTLPTPSPSADDQSLLTPSETPTPQPPRQPHTNQTTIIIAAVAAGALFLIGLGALLLFYRSGKRDKSARKPRSEKGDHAWREIESQQSHSAAHAAYATERKELYSYHSRKSSEAPPSIHLDFEPTPLMAENPFDQRSPRSPVPPVPPVPYMQDPPHSASYDNSRAPSEYSVSHYRSVYSNGETQSVVSGGTTRSRSNTLKRSGSSKSRSNQKELIALDNLIAALDLNAQDEKERQRQLDPSNVNSQRESYIPPSFPLPPPAVFRAALGSGDE